MARGPVLMLLIVCRDIGYRHIHFKVEKLAEDIWCQNVSKGTILFKYSTKLSTRIVNMFS